MDLVIKVAISIFGISFAIIADTYRKEPNQISRKITKAGYTAIILLILTLVLSMIKEYRVSAKLNASEKREQTFLTKLNVLEEKDRILLEGVESTKKDLEILIAMIKSKRLETKTVVERLEKIKQSIPFLPAPPGLLGLE